MSYILYIFVTVICVFIWYLVLKKKYNYWEVKGIKTIRPVFPILGSTAPVLLERIGVSDFFKEKYDLYNDEQLIGYFSGCRRGLIVRDPELIRCIMVKDYQHFISRNIVYNKDDLLADSLALMDGNRWKVIRKKLSPAFSSGKLKNMYPLIQNCCEDFQTYIAKVKSEGKDPELKSLTDDLAITVIGSTAFGINIQAMQDRNCEFRRYGRKIIDPSFENFWKFGLNAICPSLFILLKVNFFGKYEKFFMSLFKAIISSRERGESTRRNDFIDLCIEIKEKRGEDDSDHDVKLTDELLCAQAFFFFLAGFETSSMTLSYSLYELAMNSKIQDKLYDEIERLYKKYAGKITHDFLHDAPYLDKVVDETLRKYPPVGIQQRVCNETYKFGAEGKYLLVEKDTEISIPVFALHRDPKYYPDPEKYDPERFSSEEISKRPAFTYLPFSEGPRICLGLRYAKIQIKTGLISILMNYKIAKSSRTPETIKLQPGTFLTKAEGIWVDFIERSSPDH